MAKNKSKSLSRIIVVILILLIVLAVLQLSNNHQQKSVDTSQSDFTIYMLDVGQGDCIFIDNGDNDILIDSGPDDVSDTIASQLSRVGADEIEYFFISHCDADHIGGADNVIEGLNIKNVVMSDDERTTKNYKRLMSALDEKQITCKYAGQGDTFDIGKAHIEILSPDKTDNEEGNNQSLVMLIKYDGIKYLFTGDAEKEIESELLDEYSVDELDCDLLKVSHHGSKTSSTEEFLSTVTPQFSLISVGADNSNGHPNSKVLDRLNKYSENILRTDIDGTVVICEKDGVLWRAG